MAVNKLQQPENDNSKRIIRFRQQAYLLILAGYSKAELAEKLSITPDNFSKYYNDLTFFPGLKFLDKFDEVFGSEVKSLIDYLKAYKKEEQSTLEEPSQEYSLPVYLNDYIESLKDLIGILKSDREFDKDQITFLKTLIERPLTNNASGQEEDRSKAFSVRIVTPENEGEQSGE